MTPAVFYFALPVSILLAVTQSIAATGSQQGTSDVFQGEKRAHDTVAAGNGWMGIRDRLRQRRAMAIKNKVGSRRWPNGVIYYAIDPNDFTPGQKTNILKAIGMWEKFTCLKFVNRYSTNMIKIQHGNRCHSIIGMMGGSQVLELADGCKNKIDRILHELGHAIGLVHEHQRPDRDDYVTINFNNVKPASKGQFVKFHKWEVQDFGIPYDYEGIMEYQNWAFSKNGQETIVPKTVGQALGPSSQNAYVKLTYRDIWVVNMMYPCDKKCSNQGVHSYMCTSGFLGKDCNCWCEPALKGATYDECEIDIFG